MKITVKIECWNCEEKIHSRNARFCPSCGVELDGGNTGSENGNDTTNVPAGPNVNYNVNVNVQEIGKGGWRRRK